MVPIVLLLRVLLLQGGGGGGGGSGRALVFSAPSRVYPRGNETARTFGGLCQVLEHHIMLRIFPAPPAHIAHVILPVAAL